MAQVLAVQGDLRHGFDYRKNFKHDFGRITGIAGTTKGNILLCDYDKKCLFLVDQKGDLLNILDLDSEPFDVVITSQNIGYITQPNTESVLQIDPDRMVILHRVKSNDHCTPGSFVSTLPNVDRCYFGVKFNGKMYAYPVNGYNITLNHQLVGVRTVNPLVVRFRAIDINTYVSCIGGQSCIHFYRYDCGVDHFINSESMDIPTDICSDNNGHIYVSGQSSNNILRLTKDGKILDIPLDIRHGITQPVALCFNRNYNKLYVVIEWGKSVSIFDVI